MTTENLTIQTPQQIDSAIFASIMSRRTRQTSLVINRARLDLINRRIAEDVNNNRDAAADAQSLARVNASIADLTAFIDAAKAAEKPFHDEFDRRGGWTRFFLATSTGGHIHSTTHCSTCNKRTKRTEFAWLPDVSGLTEADAVAAHGPLLCTVCYPSAPTEWTEKPKTSRCAGSASYDYPRETARTGYRYGNYGVCSHCEENVTLTATGKMRAHKPAAS